MSELNVLQKSEAQRDLGISHYHKGAFRDALKAFRNALELLPPWEYTLQHSNEDQLKGKLSCDSCLDIEMRRSLLYGHIGSCQFKLVCRIRCSLHSGVSGLTAHVQKKYKKAVKSFTEGRCSSNLLLLVLISYSSFL